MVVAIKQSVTVQPGGLVEVRSAELTPGLQAEVIVLVEQPTSTTTASQNKLPSDWRRFAGIIDSGDPRSSDNERIDDDLAREYGSAEPQDQ